MQLVIPLSRFVFLMICDVVNLISLMLVLAADLYSELREDARDHARIRNAYFEQVCCAILLKSPFWLMSFGGYK